MIVEQLGADKVIATDIDPEQIKRAKKNLRHELKDKIEFRVADAMALDKPGNKFDAVFSFGVIHHMEDRLICQGNLKGTKERGRVLF